MIRSVQGVRERPPRRYLLGRRRARENVSIYLGTRSRRINGSRARNLSRRVCRRVPLRISWRSRGDESECRCIGVAPIAAFSSNRRHGRQMGSRLFSAKIDVAIETRRNRVFAIVFSFKNWILFQNKQLLNISLGILKNAYHGEFSISRSLFAAPNNPGSI